MSAMMRCAVALSLAVSVGACSTTASDGRVSLAAGDIEDDVRIGRENHPKIMQQYGGSYDDAELVAFVDRVGQRLKAVSEYSDIPFTFTVLDSEVVNAFALPGGYVYVSRGLLALAQDEAEIAGVIGHEIGHVTSRHGAERQTAGAIGGILGVLGAVGGAVLGGDVGARAGAQLGQLVVGGGIAQYSQGQEFESDKLGVRYLGRAGYDTRAMGDFLEALQTNAELQAKISDRPLSSGGMDHFFSSHPYTPDRVTRARSRAAERQVVGQERNREGYLRVIDGMIFGESPAQGYTMGQRFAHSELRFEFEVPDGYELRNTPNAVLASAKGRQAIFDIGKRDPGVALTRYSDEKWVDFRKLRDVERLRLRSGLDGAIGFGEVKTSRGSAEGGFVVIEGDDGQVYRFALLASDFGSSEERDLRDIARSFRRLSRAEANDLEPLRIRMVPVRQGDTIDDFVRRMEVETLPREQFLTLNAFDRGRDLQVGDQVRIIVRE